MTADPGKRQDGFAPIGDYALLGDGRTTALVAIDGSIDWWTLPVMDKPPVFDRLLGGDGGGRFELCPTEPFRARRRYRPDTAVLETTFETDAGTVTVVDSLNRQGDRPMPWSELARVVEDASAAVPMRWRIAPGRRFASAEPWCARTGGTVTIELGDQSIGVVASDAGTPEVRPHEVCGTFVAQPGTTSVVALVATDREPLPVPDAAELLGRVQDTTEGWRAWRRRIRYDGPRREAVVRSAVTLTLLTSSSEGANIAAATTSLPEVIGGDRNFDYRFAWVRDASLALDALSELGMRAEVHASLSWLLRAVARTAPDVHVFYTLGGEPASGTMSDVSALAGYLGTSPVHVGNNAAVQRQLGAYGHLMDAVWRYVEHGGRLDPATCRLVGELADRTCDLWRSKDAGLWELSQYETYTSSKVGCWVAVDRAVRFSDAGQLVHAHADRWRSVRADIHEWVDRHCWSPTKRAYTMHAGTDDLDAAVLLMARTGFCAPGDQRFNDTVDAIRTELTAGGPLLFRYSSMKGKEGAFAACSFWLVEALAHCGRREEAARQFEASLAYCNDVGLLSEEIDPTSGDLLGNMPQGLSHLALIGAACSLSRGASGG
jgi:GH15 family glucan-1,4-alpha-glucosidase